MHKPHLLASETLYHYLLAVSSRETELQKALREETIETIPQSLMMILPDQGQFLALLIRLINARRVIELGVFTGYGSLAMALALPEEGKLIGCDINPDWCELGEKYWQKAGVAHKIQLKIAPALETLQALLDNSQQASFDLIFIDADKINYPQYYEYALKLLRKGGLMVIDNVLTMGEDIVYEQKSPGAKAVNELNQKLLKDERVHLSMISIGEGMTLAQKLF